MRKKKWDKHQKEMNNFVAEISNKQFEKKDLKDFSSKLPLSKIQWKAIASDQGVMGIYKFAQKKYGNILSWRNRSEGSKERYLDAMIRHLFVILNGEDIDPESGLHHGAAMAWNALTYLEFVIEDMEKKDNV